MKENKGSDSPVLCSPIRSWESQEDGKWSIFLPPVFVCPFTGGQLIGVYVYMATILIIVDNNLIIILF
jgi:hypothetical protein